MSAYYGHPPKCDRCGRFHKAATPGASWLEVPACDIPGEYGSEADRCKPCTEKHGIPQCGPNHVAVLVSGVYSGARHEG